MSSVALQNLWAYIQSLSLNKENREWLAGKLTEPQSYDVMPCTFTDEEWKEEVRLSEEEGYASEEEVKKFFEAWEIAK